MGYNSAEATSDVLEHMSSLDEEIFEAVENTPLYIDLYKDVSQHDILTRFNQLPTITKKDIVESFPNNFITPSLLKAREDKQLEFTATSGTTSDRMQVMRKKNWWKGEYERTSFHNNSLRRHFVEGRKKAIFTTAVCSNTVCHLHAPSYEERIINGTLYLNSNADPNAWSPQDIHRICDEIELFQPSYIDADPIYLALFFKKAFLFNIELPQWTPDVLTLSYEFVPENCRRIIKRYWDVPTFNLYGSTETGYLFCECEAGHFHSIERLSRLDFIPFAERPRVAQLCVTSLKNEFMPLVRYLIGDLVLLKEPFLSQCSCGAEGGVQIEKLMGRTKDSFLNGNNELVTMKDIDELVADVPEILNYKIDLRDTESTFFKYTTFDDSDVSEKALNMLAQRLRELFSSSFSFQFQWESSLSPEQSGKFSLLARGQR